MDAVATAAQTPNPRAQGAEVAQWIEPLFFNQRWRREPRGWHRRSAT